MKKNILVIALALFSFTTNAQFSLGAGVGLPTGDIEELYSLQTNISATYMFESESDFTLGVSARYINYVGDELDVEIFGSAIDLGIDNASFLPIAAVLNYSLSDKFSLGTDVGYALGINPDGNDGGFYLRPNLGYSLGDKSSLNFSYFSTSVDGGSYDNIGLGIAFQLGGDAEE